MRGESVDLPHVPLQPGERLAVTARHGRVGEGAGIEVDAAVHTEPGGGAGLNALLLDGGFKAVAIRTGDHDADRRVVGDKRSAGGLYGSGGTRRGFPGSGRGGHTSQ